MKAIRQISTGKVIYREGSEKNADKWIHNANHYRGIDIADMELIHDATELEVSDIGKDKRERLSYKKLINDKLNEIALDNLKSNGKIPEHVLLKDIFN